MSLENLSDKNTWLRYKLYCWCLGVDEQDYKNLKSYIEQTKIYIN